MLKLQQKGPFGGVKLVLLCHILAQQLRWKILPSHRNTSIESIESIVSITQRSNDKVCLSWRRFFLSWARSAMKLYTKDLSIPGFYFNFQVHLNRYTRWGTSNESHDLRIEQITEVPFVLFRCHCSLHRFFPVLVEPPHILFILLFTIFGFTWMILCLCL